MRLRDIHVNRIGRSTLAVKEGDEFIGLVWFERNTWFGWAPHKHTKSFPDRITAIKYVKEQTDDN